jgi:hypothetical protein
VNQIYLDLVMSAIFEQFHSEQDFYQDYLGVNDVQWQQWKAGQNNLSPEANQKIKNLFSDYEWMLSQKVIRQTFLFPEKRPTAVAEYRDEDDYCAAVDCQRIGSSRNDPIQKQK